EVLVPAAHGEIGSRHVDVHRAHRMGQVPHHQRPRIPCRGVDVGNRMTAPGAVVDVGEGDHGDVRGDTIEHLIGGHRHHFGAGLVVDGVEDVEVGGEVAGVGEDVPAVGAQAA